jgi:hypothetical protein
MMQATRALYRLDRDLQQTMLVRDHKDCSGTSSTMTMAELTKVLQTMQRIQQEQLVRLERAILASQAEDDDDGTSLDDDSALYCPTVRPTEEQDTTLETHWVSIGTHHQDEDDNLSEETPFLDRYRLETDDTSPHGFKVVPNERGVTRGCRTSSRRHNPPPPTTRTTASSMKKEVAFDLTAAESLAGTVVVPNPYPRRVTNNGNDHGIVVPVESRCESPPSPAAVSTSSSSTAATTVVMAERDLNQHSWSSSSFTEATPGKSHVGFEQADANPVDSTFSDERVHEFAENTQRITTPTTPQPTQQRRHAASLPNYLSPLVAYSASRIFEDRPQSCPGSSRLDQVAAVVTPRALSQTTRCVAPITLGEYESAPRVVRMQMTLDELRRAVACLNQMLQKRAATDAASAAMPVHLTFEEALEILSFNFASPSQQQQSSTTTRKLRSILMGLCHFRRLILHQVPAPSSAVQGTERDICTFEIRTL